MKTLPLLLVASLATAVVLAGCAGNDDESTGDASGGNGQTGRELSTDVSVGGGNETGNSTMETNESDATNETSG